MLPYSLPTLEEEDRPGSYWIIFMSALFGAIFVRSLFVAATMGEVATTQPIEFTPRQTAFIAAISSLAMIAVVVLGNAILSPKRLAKLGMSLAGIPRGLLYGAAATVVVLPLMFLAVIGTQLVWQYFQVQHPDAHQMLRLMRDDPAPQAKGLLIFTATFLGPIAEEILFRATLQTAVLYTLSRRPNAYHRWAAIIGTSVIFTAFHGEYWLMPPIFLLSICLGYLYQITSNLWAPIVLHCAFNIANVVLFLYLNRH